MCRIGLGNRCSACREGEVIAQINVAKLLAVTAMNDSGELIIVQQQERRLASMIDVGGDHFNIRFPRDRYYD